MYVGFHQIVLISIIFLRLSVSSVNFNLSLIQIYLFSCLILSLFFYISLYSLYYFSFYIP